MKLILISVVGSLAALFLAPYAMAAGKKLAKLAFNTQEEEQNDNNTTN